MPTLDAILANVETDAPIDMPGPAGRQGERLLKLPSGELVVTQVAVSATTQPERPHPVVHPGALQPESPAPTITDEPDPTERDAAEDDFAAQNDGATEDDGAAQDDGAAEDDGATQDDGATEDDGADQDQLTTQEVRRRAVTGAIVDAIRAMGVRVLGLVGSVVTARLLTPYDFGLVAIGMTVLSFGSLLDDGGIGLALIRRPEPPTKSELQALVAFQFGLELVLAIAIGLAMLPFGVVGQVTAVVLLSLPLSAFRTPAVILYERRLDYRPMAVVDVVQTLFYYVWAIVTISIGWGVWGLATAIPASAFVGLLLLLVYLPEGRVAPVPSWTKVRGLLGFGIRFQGVNLLHLLRDQGVNIVVASFGGVAVLGLWNIAWRIIQLPVSLLWALWRVSFPGMSRLVAAKEDVGPTIERVIALSVIGTGVLVVPLAASSSAWIHLLIGAQWTDAAGAIPPACFAMIFGVPISVALSGYLWAIGAASVQVRAAAATIPPTLLLLFILLPLLGVAAAGIAYIASSLFESLVFVYAARRTTSFKVSARLSLPVALAVLSAWCGWVVERLVGLNVAGALLSSSVALGLFVGGLVAVQHADIEDARRLIARGLRGAVATPASS